MRSPPPLIVCRPGNWNALSSRTLKREPPLSLVTRASAPLEDVGKRHRPQVANGAPYPRIFHRLRRFRTISTAERGTDGGHSGQAMEDGSEAAPFPISIKTFSLAGLASNEPVHVSARNSCESAKAWVWAAVRLLVRRLEASRKCSFPIRFQKASGRSSELASNEPVHVSARTQFLSAVASFCVKRRFISDSR